MRNQTSQHSAHTTAAGVAKPNLRLASEHTHSLQMAALGALSVGKLRKLFNRPRHAHLSQAAASCISDTRFPFGLRHGRRQPFSTPDATLLISQLLHFALPPPPLPETVAVVVGIAIALIFLITHCSDGTHVWVLLYFLKDVELIKTQPQSRAQLPPSCVELWSRRECPIDAPSSPRSAR